MLSDYEPSVEESKTIASKEDGIVNLKIGSCSTVPFYRSSHLKYIAHLGNKLDSPTSYMGAVTEHLRMSGIYWTYTALSLLVSTSDANSIIGNDPSSSELPRLVDWVLKCYDSNTGGFGGNIGHDGHLLYTLSALQILVIAEYDLNQLAVEDIVKFIVSLQQEDGSFAGDQWGEIDTRFSYCALSALSLLSNCSCGLDCVDVDKAVEYIASCQNLDGGFGSMKGAESHAGQVFCCVGALSIAKSLNVIRRPDLLGWWLAERQCDSGGLNGRPEKQADVCYSWWILSVLSIMDRLDWISEDKLASFITKAQDPDDGGIADRPEDMPDIFHTFFGIAGLSLLGKLPDSYRKIDPVYALPIDVVERCGLSAQIIRRKECEADDWQLQHYDVLKRT
mmetsp:Transcript_1583/g.4134  ORF Transcript_1583/g.4134 Transcript_1583/m.4134 type:complete len:392 (+) Transcript_1583:656-1831(+)|eukprot:CAMPEP_0172377264 /NCGR_PEP_ID=MMETSP1060-20121228/68813_1 /TAXON_ID=37318 /ORGANISM="Pseudo-nitzschia pungens, Strain cf. cingulata" /LENGTH=391 /DNA_ID=CAMNT_0013104943 /DNA_START=619 /DNA_END=1794 /DNA_ORIENTATION=-